MNEPLSIVQVNTYEQRGGAARVAWQLFDAYRDADHRSTLVVGRGETTDNAVSTLQEDGQRHAAHLAAGPGRLLDRYLGRETYRYPATHQLLDGDPPDVLHLHNLHGGYFDLRLLPALSRRSPVVLTLHDAWLLSGHCAHSLGCERWRTGCGACPDLTIYPAIRRDATAVNWERKRAIFQNARLHVATPSEWLADAVRASMLRDAVEELRVIPNGVDLDLFTPGSPSDARRTLGLPDDKPLLLTTGERLRTNPFKDLITARRAAAVAADHLDRDLILLVLGDSGPDDSEGRACVRFIPFQPDPQVTATYYRAADLYVHASHADTFPLSVLEALASGTPPVATAVGGIPEQIVSLAPDGNNWTSEAHEATGLLVRPDDAERLGLGIAHLLALPDLVSHVGRNARAAAVRHFGIGQQSARYLAWYRDIVAQRAKAQAPARPSA